MNMLGKIRIANRSDVGCARPHNEDSTASDGSRGIAVVADGMGGYRAGEVASAIAVTSIIRHLYLKLPMEEQPRRGEAEAAREDSEILREAIEFANANIYRHASTKEDYKGMGTTVVAALFHDGGMYTAHVGDSRLYRLRGTEFQQITKDHSLVQEVVDRGLCTPEEAPRFVSKTYVTRALGIGSDVVVDLGEERTRPEDIYLLCSDGLSDMVGNRDIHLTIRKYDDSLMQAAEELVNLANKQGGKDNISVILVRILGSDTRTGKPQEAQT